MAEPKIVVEHREHLWYLLTEATQLEHMIMCQYLYAAFSLKRDPAEGLTAEQAAATGRWRQVLTDIAIEEMLHLALVCNLMSAIGAAPTFGRPNFPQRSAYFPPSVQLDLLPFGADALTHFLYLERPEGMERMDAAGFGPPRRRTRRSSRARSCPGPRTSSPSGICTGPSSRGFATWPPGSGSGRCSSARRGPRRRRRLFRWPDLIAVTDLASAQQAIETIIEQGEGARGDWQAAHYGRFLGIWDEYSRLAAADPAFQPARPVLTAFTQQPFDLTAQQPLISDPATRQVARLFALGYEVLLQVLTRFFTHTDETDDQLGLLTGAAFSLMSGVLGPLGDALTQLPAGPDHPGRTVGPAFEMFYLMGNFVPWQDAAWALLSERVAVLASQCATDGRAGQRTLAAVGRAAECAAEIQAKLASQVPAGNSPRTPQL